MPIKTESAVFFTANDGFKITGHIIRNETYVTAKTDGVLHFVTEDGSRVAKDGVIANIYGNANASITVSEIDVLKSQIADIEDILSYNDIEAANLDLINAKISTSLGDFIFEGASGNFNNAESLSKDLLAANNRKQVALGVATGLTERLETLKTQLAKLEGSLPSVKGSILANQSGYFVSKTDGYEKAFPNDDLSQITPEFLTSVNPQEKGKNVIGKIVSDYEWYIATVLPLNDSLKYKEDQELKLLTTIKSSPTLSVTVKQINISEETSTIEWHILIAKMI
jgi:hypothetical protein